MIDWPTATVTIGALIAILTFVWGIIKTFIPKKDRSYEQPLEKNKTELETKINEVKNECNLKIKQAEEILNKYGNKLHDLETHKDLFNKSVEDMKGEIKEVQKKYDSMLDKVIEYLKAT